MSIFEVLLWPGSQTVQETLCYGGECGSLCIELWSWGFQGIFVLVIFTSPTCSIMLVVLFSSCHSFENGVLTTVRFPLILTEE